MGCSEDKFRVNERSWPGIDKSIVDFSAVHTSKVMVTKVLIPLYKKGIIAYIGIKDLLLAGEIIQVGNLGQKYKIIGGAKKVLPRGGYLFRVKRIDGFNITSTDMGAIFEGDKVKIKSRRSFKQQFDQAVEILKS